MPKASAPTEAAVRAVLEKCIDPELGIDIVRLGLVYGVTVSPHAVAVTMTLTTPGCPLAPYFKERIRELITESFPAVTTEVAITFDPPWSPAKMSGDVRAFFGR